MHKPFFLLGILVVWMAACTAAPSSPSLSPTAAPTQWSAGGSPVVTPDFTALPTAPHLQRVTPTATVSPSPTSPPVLTPIKPEIVRLCPDNPAVPLDEFGLEDYYLVVRPYDPLVGEVEPETSGAVVVPLDHPVAQVIPGSRGRQGWKLVDYKPAADGQSVELDYQEADGNRWQVWRSSWDGQQQVQIAEFTLEPLPERESIYQSYYYHRIDEHWLAAMKSDLETGTRYPMTLYSSTGERREVPPLPEGAYVRSFFYLNGVLYADVMQGIEVDKTFLYNLETFTITPIFRWLWDKEHVFNVNTEWIFKDNLAYIHTARLYGADLGIGLNVDTIKSNIPYNQVMQPFYLPGAEEDYMIVGGFLENPPGYLYYRPDFNRDISPVYFLDFNALTVTDYCYSGADFVTFSVWSHHSVSPNQRFVAYTHGELGVEGNPDKINRVEILDLYTGEIATIPNADFDVIGWGRK